MMNLIPLSNHVVVKRDDAETTDLDDAELVLTVL